MTTPNKNGRIYSQEIVNNILKSQYVETSTTNDKGYYNNPPYLILDDVKEMVNNGRLLGELYHPNNVNGKEDVHLNNVSHVIKSVEIYDEGLYVDIEILKTPVGNILKELIDNKVQVGFSSRTDMNGKIIAIDAIMLDKVDFRRRKLEKIMTILDDKRRNNTDNL